MNNVSTPGVPASLVVIDLEATCANDGSVPRHEMEIIEIGAVLVQAGTIEPSAEFQTFVRPVRHPELTRFCTELTGIKPGMVAGAPHFPEAMTALYDWMAGFDDIGLFGSWGAYDRNQFLQDCDFHGVAYAMPDHVNLKKEFSRRQERRKQYGMAGALRLCRLDLKGEHHRALDDAKNIARLLPWIYGGKLVG